MPPFREISKNSRQRVRVGPSLFAGHDLVDVRIYSPVPGQSDLVPTKKGISVNVDVIPELISALEWALAQDPADEGERPLPSREEGDLLAQAIWEQLGAHGSAVHWDGIERMLSGKKLPKFSKRDLHYLLVVRRDLFTAMGGGTFKAVGFRRGKS